MLTPISHEIETDCTIDQTTLKLRCRFVVEWAQGADAEDLIFVDEIFLKNCAVDPFEWHAASAVQDELAEAWLQGHRRHAMLKIAYNDEQRWAAEHLGKMRAIVEAHEKTDI